MAASNQGPPCLPRHLGVPLPFEVEVSRCFLLRWVSFTVHSVLLLVLPPTWMLHYSHPVLPTWTIAFGLLSLTDPTRNARSFPFDVHVEGEA